MCHELKITVVSGYDAFHVASNSMPWQYLPFCFAACLWDCCLSNENASKQVAPSYYKIYRSCFFKILLTFSVYKWHFKKLNKTNPVQFCRLLARYPLK